MVPPGIVDGALAPRTPTDDDDQKSDDSETTWALPGAPVPNTVLFGLFPEDPDKEKALTEPDNFSVQPENDTEKPLTEPLTTTPAAKAGQTKGVKPVKPVNNVKKTKHLTKHQLAKLLADELPNWYYDISNVSKLLADDTFKILTALEELAEQQLKEVGTFTVPDIAELSIKKKPATVACQKVLFGKMRFVKAKAAATVLKAKPAAVIRRDLDWGMKCALRETEE